MICDALTQNLNDEDVRIRDYFALLKPRVMSLVVFTGFAGMWAAPGVAEVHPFLLAVSILALAIGAGSSGAINMWYDRDIDAVMTRTKDRPLPQGRIIPAEALGFALILQCLSVMMMGLAAGWVAAGLLAFASFFYVVIYTMWLKRSTPQNIVIGGAAGAFPPMIGWAAVTGDVSLYPVLLFTMIFVWTPPHFWALSLFAGEDYKRVNVPMMNVVRGIRNTKWQMLLYTLILWPITVAPYVLGYTGPVYGTISAVLSGFFVFTAWRVLRADDQDLKPARLMFGYSVFYLFALFLAVMMG